MHAVATARLLLGFQGKPAARLIRKGSVRDDWCMQAIRMPQAEQHQRHAKHWRYISHHTVKYWAQVSYRQWSCWLDPSCELCCISIACKQQSASPWAYMAQAAGQHS